MKLFHVGCGVKQGSSLLLEIGIEFGLDAGVKLCGRLNERSCGRIQGPEILLRGEPRLEPDMDASDEPTRMTRNSAKRNKIVVYSTKETICYFIILILR